MELAEFLALEGVGAITDLHWLPKPNVADVVLTDRIAPLDIIPTAFCFPFLSDGRVVLAHNRRRGAEIPGGHRDPIGTFEDQPILEDPAVTAVREALEETGVRMTQIETIGFMRSVCNGDMPDDYKYPFPNSAQQFFAGICEEPTDYEVNDECIKPVFIEPADVELWLRRDSRGFLLYKEAYRKLFG